MDEERLASLRKKDKEDDDSFSKRFNLTAEDLKRWKEVTKNGTIYGGPAIKRFFGSD